MASYSYSIEFFQRITGLSDSELIAQKGHVYALKVAPPSGLMSTMERPYWVLLLDRCIVDDFALLQLKAALDKSFFPELEEGAFVQGSILEHYTHRIRPRTVNPGLLLHFIERLEEESILAPMDVTSKLARHTTFLKASIGGRLNAAALANDREASRRLRLSTNLLASEELGLPLFDSYAPGISDAIAPRDISSASPRVVLGEFLSEEAPDATEEDMMSTLASLEKGLKDYRRSTQGFAQLNKDAILIYLARKVFAEMVPNPPALSSRSDVDELLNLRHSQDFEDFRKKVEEIAGLVRDTSQATDQDETARRLVQKEYMGIPLRRIRRSRSPAWNQFIIPGAAGAIGSAIGAILGGPGGAAAGALLGVGGQELGNRFHEWLSNRPYGWYLFLQEWGRTQGF